MKYFIQVALCLVFLQLVAICEAQSFNCTGWVCYHGQCLPDNPGAYCNGVVECNDNSDEPTGCDTRHECIGGFICGNFVCIPNSTFRCDGVAQCPDETDEKNCGECTDGGYRCRDGQCTGSQSARCNGNFECSDNSDEENCQRDECTAALYCDNGQCINPVFGGSGRCDGTIDCDDESDEQNCSTMGTMGTMDMSGTRLPPNVGCQAGQWTCLSGQCVSILDYCDGDIDCNDGSDETCTLCPSSGFRCADGRGCTVIQADRCDGYSDCFDGSDEDNCGSKCPGSRFRCANGRECISSQSYRCDGYSDCSDGSDEDNCITCFNSAFRCANGRCTTSRYARCDGISDCSDGSDEDNCGSSTSLIVGVTVGTFVVVVILPIVICVSIICFFTGAAARKSSRNVRTTNVVAQPIEPVSYVTTTQQQSATAGYPMQNVAQAPPLAYSEEKPSQYPPQGAYPPKGEYQPQKAYPPLGQ